MFSPRTAPPCRIYFYKIILSRLQRNIVIVCFIWIAMYTYSAVKLCFGKCSPRLQRRQVMFCKCSPRLQRRQAVFWKMLTPTAAPSSCVLENDHLDCSAVKLCFGKWSLRLQRRQAVFWKMLTSTAAPSSVGPSIRSLISAGAKLSFAWNSENININFVGKQNSRCWLM
jgi:hypothetical protein